MIELFCVLLSAAGFYFSIGLGEQWWLAWLAPIPVLWLAFRRERGWQSVVAVWVAYALGWASPLRAYGGFLPWPVIIASLAGPGLLFALTVLVARRLYFACGPLAGAFAFAILWAGFDFLVAFNGAGGSSSTPATSQVAVPWLIQSASLFGECSITFLLGIFSAGIAASLRSRRFAPLAFGLGLFLANAAFGAWQMSTPPTGTVRTALINSDDTDKTATSGNKEDLWRTIEAYSRQIEALRGKGIKLVVLPEKIAIVQAPWANAAQAKLAALARDLDATLVVGFDLRDGSKSYNISWAFTPEAASPAVYQKRHLVPGLEARYTIGPGPVALSDGTGLEICKDMDFEGMIRADQVATKPTLLAVSAWDFEIDGWSHARIAILHSVENGLPMVRAGRDGLLTLTDRYGRLITEAKTTVGFQTVIGDLPLAGRGGETIYDKIGDVFGWSCVVAGIVIVGIGMASSRSVRLTTPA